MDGAILVHFLGGAVAVSYAIGGLYFFRFWRHTRDQLFLMFGLAFWLFAVNRTVASLFGDDDEHTTAAFGLRVLGYLLILYAIARKNAVRASAGD